MPLRDELQMCPWPGFCRSAGVLRRPEREKRVLQWHDCTDALDVFCLEPTVHGPRSMPRL